MEDESQLPETEDTGSDTGVAAPSRRYLNLLSQGGAAAATMAFLLMLAVAAILLWLGRAPSTPDAAVEMVVSVSLLLMAAMVTTLFLVALYLMRGRVAVQNTQALVPEEWAALLKGLTDTTSVTQKSVSREIQALGNIERLLRTLQDGLDQRDSEIARHRRGYDQQVFRNFVTRFVKVDEFLREELEEQSDEPNQSLVSAHRLLEDALDECGVEAFEPNLGTDYRDCGPTVQDGAKRIPTSNESDDFTISEVLTPGYRFSDGRDDAVLRPAKVAVFAYTDPNHEDKS